MNEQGNETELKTIKFGRSKRNGRNQQQQQREQKSADRYVFFS
jgi:hypothetical protein